MASTPNDDAAPGFRNVADEHNGAAPEPDRPGVEPRTNSSRETVDGAALIGAAPLPETGRAEPMSRLAIEQKLTDAGLNLRRGRIDEARRDVDDVLAAAPRYAAAHELLGDIESHLGRYPEACAAYRAALKAEPGRPTADLKLGRTALRATEAAGGFQTLAEDLPVVPRGGRALAGFASALLPGLGQIIQGAFLKGGVMLGVYCLANFLILCLPETKDMMRDVGGMFTPGRGGAATPISGFFWLLSAISTIDWLYAVIDAARAKD